MTGIFSEIADGKLAVPTLASALAAYIQGQKRELRGVKSALSDDAKIDLDKMLAHLKELNINAKVEYLQSAASHFLLMIDGQFDEQTIRKELFLL